MSAGEYIIQDIPIGIYTVTASKESYIFQPIENIEVLEEQTTVINFELIGGETMEHIIDISITNCEEETIYVPDGCVTKPYRLVGKISNIPISGKTVELLTSDATTVLQTETTDTDGVVTFTNTLYGNYKMRIL